MIALYYYENLTLREIGEVLGVTESRVSQLHTKAVLRLRSKLGRELDYRAARRRRRLPGSRAGRATRGAPPGMLARRIGPTDASE